MASEPAALAIRPARMPDMEAVAQIYGDYVRDTVITFETDPPTVAVWKRRLGELGSCGWPFLVALAGGEVVGYAYVAPWRARPAYRYTVEDSIYLRVDFAGRGHGRRLLQELLEAAARAGACQVIAVIADTGNPASTAVHEALGFRRAGRLDRVGYKHGRWLDVVLLQASLGRPQAAPETGTAARPDR